jgi:hypothetical protein
MIYKHVFKNTVDVFTGKGWENWSRFQLQGKQLKLIKGQPLSKEDYTKLRAELLA